MRFARTHRTAALAVLAAAALATACSRGNRYAPPPPPEVTVSHPIEQEVTVYNEFTGRTQAIETVDLVARVQGFLRSINFTPGTDIQQGQLLFVIEPDLYEAQVEVAQGNLEGSEAQYSAAQTQLEITQAIYERSAGSRTDLVQKTQTRDLAKAQVDTAKANLAAAKLNLSYTHIYAPFSGRIDRNLVDVGNLVGAGQATPLASLVRHEPMYAYFTASERELLRYFDMRRKRKTVAGEGEPTPAYLGLASEDGYPHVGQVDYSSNRVDPETGTIELRAVFPNSDRILIPGLFARIRLPLTRERALLVPDAAVSFDQGGQYLLVVNDKNVVEYRRVKPGPLIEGMRVISQGIEKEEWVVIIGIERARPGLTVKPKQVETPEPPAVDPTLP
jgi:RND family efflux transporter MFP subunit